MPALMPPQGSPCAQESSSSVCFPTSPQVLGGRPFPAAAHAWMSKARSAVRCLVASSHYPRLLGCSHHQRLLDQLTPSEAAGSEPRECKQGPDRAHVYQSLSIYSAGSSICRGLALLAKQWLISASLFEMLNTEFD